MGGKGTFFLGLILLLQKKNNLNVSEIRLNVKFTFSLFNSHCKSFTQKHKAPCKKTAYVSFKYK